MQTCRPEPETMPSASPPEQQPVVETTRSGRSVSAPAVFEHEHEIRACATGSRRTAGNTKDARIAELEEQVRDLMLYLDASAKIEQVTAGGEGSGGGERGGAGSAELRDGSVVGISAAPTPPTPEELRRRARAKGKAQRNAAH